MVLSHFCVWLVFVVVWFGVYCVCVLVFVVLKYWRGCVWCGCVCVVCACCCVCVLFVVVVERDECVCVLLCGVFVLVAWFGA